MKNFIEELYYGNINPKEHSMEDDEITMGELERLVKLEEKLMANLTEENKKLFSEWMETDSRIQERSELDTFMTGFRLGAKLIFDTFLSSDAPFRETEDEQKN